MLMTPPGVADCEGVDMLKVICLAHLLEGVEDPPEARALGVCGTHYQQARRAGFIEEHPGKDPCPKCLVEKAEKVQPVKTRKRCQTHYRQGLASGELGPAYAPRLPKGQKRVCKECLKDGKTVLAKSHELCPAHLGRQHRGTDGTNKAPIREPSGPICSFGGCGNPTHSGDLCGGHDWQKKNNRPLTPLRVRKSPGGPCEVTSHACPHKAVHEGFCNRHYQRNREGEENWDRPIKAKATNGSGHVDKHGYRFITIDGAYVSEHRHVMEQHVGRPLLPTETVHHKTGGFKGRSNNDISNLELWTGRHPKGHRIEDVVLYAYEMLAMYGTADDQERYAEFRAAVESDTTEETL